MRRLVVLAALALAGLAADHADAAPPEAVEILADMTLIDQECRDVTVVFGEAFRLSEAAGLDVADVMPGGSLREAFEAAFRRRFASLSHEALCGGLVRAYAARDARLFQGRAQEP